MNDNKETVILHHSNKDEVPVYDFEWEPNYDDELFWSANEEVIVPQNFNDDY